MSAAAKSPRSRKLSADAGRSPNLGAACVDPPGLPLPAGAPVDHPKVQERRDLSFWPEGRVWTSPERHGALGAVIKAQIDWIPLSVGAIRPTQGRTLPVMQVSGGSQSFNAVNQMRVLGRRMRMVTSPTRLRRQSVPGVG